MVKKILKTFLLIFFLASCNKFIKSDSEKYFEETFNLIKENSVKKDEIEWTDLNKTIRDSIKDFNSNYDVHLAIAYTVRLINDDHSIFGAPKKSSDEKAINAKKSNNNKLSISPITTKIIDNDIGYIKLTGLNIINDSLSRNYTLEIRKALLDLDSAGKLSGWIIDLRKHGGGKMSCESLGLSPLFDHKLIGFVRERQNDFIEITCTNSTFSYGNNIQEILNYDSTLINKNKKIAILIGKNTVSSGEFLALAFKFQDNTKTFGKPTRGKTSHCGLYHLKDDAVLLLAKSYFYDKNKNIINVGIKPDVECDTENSLTKAISWIKTPYNSKYK